MSMELAMRDLVRAAVREEVRELEERLVERLAGSSSGGMMSLKKAAARAGVSTALLRKWRQAGKLREYHAGRKRLVKWDDVEALMVAPAEAAEPVATVDSIMDRISKRKAG